MESGAVIIILVVVVVVVVIVIVVVHAPITCGSPLSRVFLFLLSEHDCNRLRSVPLTSQKLASDSCGTSQHQASLESTLQLWDVRNQTFLRS